MKKITAADKAVLNYIKIYIWEHGYPPSVREIGDGVGLKSTSSVQVHIKKLIELGVLETDAEMGTPRALRVPGYIFAPGKYPYDCVCEHCGEEYIRAGHREYMYCPFCGHKKGK